MKEEIILGTLLGDAYIGKLHGRAKSYSIKWQHCLEQEEYALWKAENSLNNFSVYKRSRLDTRTNNIYHSITCYSTKDNYEYYRNLFYFDKKEVSQEILNMLTPLSIAVWFMDDGNLYYNGNNCHLNLATHGFNNDSTDKIINYFKVKYNINFKKHGKAIRITSVKQVRLFESFFKKYYHSSMLYKTLDFNIQKHKNNG
jgi:recombination protein RecA